MSIINQMLQDIELRRTATPGPSPLGGLSASDTTSGRSSSLNFMLLGAVVVLAIVTAFLFGSQRATPVPIVVSNAAPAINKNLTNNTKAVEVVVASSATSLQSVKTEPASTAPITKPIVKPIIQRAKKSIPAVELAVSAKENNIEVVNHPVASVAAKSSVAPVNVKADQQAVVNGESSAPVIINKRIRPLSTEQQAQQLFQKAVISMGRGKQTQAHSELNQALEIDPSHVRSRETLAALLLNSGRISEAGTILREGLQMNPGLSSLAKLYARILVDQGDTIESIAVLERAAPKVSADPEYHALLAAFYQRAGKHGQAAQSYQRVLSIRPNVAQWWMGLALSLESMSDATQALTSYQRAQRLGGLSPQVQLFIAERVRVLAPVSSKNTQSVKG